MVKFIKTVKTTTQLRRLLETTSVGKELLQKWIALDPIFVGTTTSANYEQSIHKHLIESTKHVKDDGHWCEFGVMEGRSLKWLIAQFAD